MQFGIKKCGVLTIERGKVIRTDGIRLADGQHMKDIDETGYIYLEILETDKMEEKEMKEKFSKEYLWRLRLILRSKLNKRNKITEKKRMYGQYLREMPETTDEQETWYWLRKADLKVETEAMLCAA